LHTEPPLTLQVVLGPGLAEIDSATSIGRPPPEKGGRAMNSQPNISIFERDSSHFSVQLRRQA
jgi:hypothetical protein